jgi:hypothetical protein
MNTRPSAQSSTGTIFSLLCFSAVLGVVAATTGTCLAGLTTGTGTWCGGLILVIGVPAGVVVGVALGFPLQLLFSRLNLRQWWQYVLGGTLLAVPIWYELAGPFTTARWEHAGFFDSMNLLGSGAAAGLFFWYFSVKLNEQFEG